MHRRTLRALCRPARLVVLAAVALGACSKTQQSVRTDGCDAGQATCGSGCLQSGFTCCANSAPCPNPGDKCLTCSGVPMCAPIGASCCGGRPCGTDGWRCFLCKGGAQCQPENSGCQTR